jgi:hypothetical protein
MMPFCSAARIVRFSYGSVRDLSQPQENGLLEMCKRNGWWTSHVADDSLVADDSHDADDSHVADDSHGADDSIAEF